MLSVDTFLNMKKIQAIILFLILLGLCESTIAQSSFRKLSHPEKCWVLCHPFKARKAQVITKRVQFVVDSIKKTGTIGADENGGKLDAFKHTFWMTSLALKIGKKQSIKLGKAHEKGNYLQFKRHTLEDSILPDSISSEMDYRNNEIGTNSFFGKCHFKITETEIVETVLRKLKSGGLFIIKKDSSGNYLDCNGAIIDMELWLGKWGIPKCLIQPKED